MRNRQCVSTRRYRIWRHGSEELCEKVNRMARLKQQASWNPSTTTKSVYMKVVELSNGTYGNSEHFVVATGSGCIGMQSSGNSVMIIPMVVKFHHCQKHCSKTSWGDDLLMATNVACIKIPFLPRLSSMNDLLAVSVLDMHRDRVF